MGQLRITGGQWRSQRIQVARSAALRPTPDSVRETLFNWLGQDLSGWRCLDLFAGSGILGIEAASRGAQMVTLVENNRQSCKMLARTLEKLAAPNIELVATDALKYIHSALAAHPYDLVFVDPPYNSPLLQRITPVLEQLLSATGWLYVEAGAAITSLGCLRSVKEGRAGQVYYQLLNKQGTH